MHNTFRFDGWRKRTLIEVKRLTWLFRLNHLVSENSVSGLLSACKCNYDAKAKSCYSRWLFILFVRTERDEERQTRLCKSNYHFSCRVPSTFNIRSPIPIDVDVGIDWWINAKCLGLNEARKNNDAALSKFTLQAALYRSTVRVTKSIHIDVP